MIEKYHFCASSLQAERICLASKYPNPLSALLLFPGASAIRRIVFFLGGVRMGAWSEDSGGFFVGDEFYLMYI